MKRYTLFIAAMGLPVLSAVVSLRADEAAQQNAILQQRNAVLQKMAEIKIPEIDFRQASVPDVISFLQDAGFNFDRNKRGVNMVYNPRRPRTVGAKPAGGGGEEEPPAQITFKAKEISLLEALNAIVQTANLEYHIEGSVVIINPAPKQAPQAPQAPASESTGTTENAVSPPVYTPPDLTTAKTLTAPRLKTSRPGK